MQCPYPPQHRHNRKFLCKGDHRNNCTDMVTSQSRFTLQDDVSSSSFTVLITELRARDAGTYWCGSDPQWSPADYTQIELSLVIPPLTSTVTPDITVEPVGSQSTLIPDKHIKDVSPVLVVVFVVLAVLLILAFTLVVIYKCHRKGQEVSLSRNITKTAEAEETTYEVQGDVACSTMGSSKQQSMLYHNKAGEDQQESVYQNITREEDIYCNL
uniref:CMRF35-like molecule 8 n=1 Tax=Epinephelus lanceolatus TaxID=310571 RepID=UPI0014451695|nr:CMRF35-like molecule 8 [Epinephelus lanceolatus]